MHKLVVCTHTDRRNMLLKTFAYVFVVRRITHIFCNVTADSHVPVDGLAEGMCGKIPHLKIKNGNDADMKYMMDMRNSLVHYVHFIDIYAPCIVGHSHWNDRSNILQYCGKGGALFNEFILSLSDEAFLLLVLYNYKTTWMSELQFEQAKVSCNCDACVISIVLMI